MTSEVKMPQLGMNQDSAVIVSWLKTAGDKVATGEPIFEVETDKATVEVEAATDGFLSGIQAAEGADVPVGDVIAMIVDSEEDVTRPVSTPEEQETATVPAPDPTPNPKPNEAETPAAPKVVPPAMPAGKVLASPLAKRVAAEQGIDLLGLRAAGVSEPIHSADVAHVPSGGLSVLTARVDGSALTGLLERSDGANRSNLFAAFASRSWSVVFESAQVAVAIRGLDGATTLYPDASEADVAVTLVDLCDTRIASFAPAGGGTTLVAARDGDTYALTLSFNEQSLPFAAAVALLDAIAARVEDPIRQLL